MPQLRGVTVHVTDNRGNGLPEWGIQHLRQSDRISAYVQSTTDAAFQVSVQPRIPFIDPHHPLSDTEVRHISRNTCASSEDTFQGPGHNDGILPFSSPLQWSKDCKKAKVPPFSFIAVLYLDGRTRPERKVIVYTDPNDGDFNYPNGKVTFKHRWIQTKDGAIAEHGWVFKDKAIETVFDKLVLSGTAAKEQGKDDEDALVEALQSSAVNPGHDQDHKAKVGQIVVEISRVTLGPKYSEEYYRPKLQEGRDDDVNMDDVHGEITHATAFVRKGTLQPKRMRVVEYSPYKQDDGVYARFQFFYRSQEQLQHFGFPGFPAVSKTPAKTGRLLNASMATLTPLSISQGAASTLKKSSRDMENDSYEDKVKKRSFKQDENPNHKFGLEHRDAREGTPAPKDCPDIQQNSGKHHGSPFGFGEQDALTMGGKPRSRKGCGLAIDDNSGKHPAAPLPFIEEVLEAQKKGSVSAIVEKSEKYLDAPLPFMEEVLKTQKQPIRYPAVGENSSDANLSGPSLQGGEDDLGFRLGTFAATGIDNPFHGKINNRLRLINTGEVSESSPTEEATVNTPNSTTVEPPSSPFSPTSLNKENLAKLSADRAVRTLKSHSDSDDDAYDELATESDLETHIGDEDFPYTANPEEDDEGYHTLRSQLNNFGIRKRGHAEIEDAEEDEVEGSSGLVGSERSRNVSRSKEISPLDLTEESKQAQRGKKVRFSDPVLLQDTSETAHEITQGATGGNGESVADMRDVD